MSGKKLNFTILVFVSVLLWFVSLKYPDILLKKGFFTVLSFTVVYFVFRVVFEEIFIKKVKGSKAKYSFKKTVSILFQISLIVERKTTNEIKTISTLTMNFSNFSVESNMLFMDTSTYIPHIQ
jgi:hypothetical protein